MYDFTRDLDETGQEEPPRFRRERQGRRGPASRPAELPDSGHWWYQEVVGGSYRLQREGDIPSSTVKDGQEICRHARGTASRSPRASRRSTSVDESYKRMWISPRSRPLLTTDNPNSDRTLAWLSPNPEFRVVAIQLGHGPSAFANPSYRALVHNAILWAAGRIRDRRFVCRSRSSMVRPSRLSRSRQRSRDETRSLQHHLPGPLVSRRGALAARHDRPGQGIRLRRDRDRRQAAARQSARLARRPLPRAAFDRRWRGHRDLRRRGQQRLQQPRPRGPRGRRSASSATSSG